MPRRTEAKGEAREFPFFSSNGEEKKRAIINN
jgi:hypothetical protein